MSRREAESAPSPLPDATLRRSAAAPVGLPVSVGGYRVVRLLGEGGMGAVYHARDDRLERDLAVKTMRPEIAAQPGAAERFLREARAAAKVAHDNVVPIWQVGEDGGAPFIVMPLLAGAALDRWLRRDPMPPLAAVLKVGREVTEGLAAAHASGLIHRDVKPANIWIEGDPAAADFGGQFRRAKLLDFGLARPAADDTQLTGTGAVVGTPAYMSPEQARGLPVDHRTDLFSLGCVLYRMTTGVLPFRGDSTLAVLTSLATDEPPPPAAVNPGVPPALSDLIVRLLAKDRERRPASAAAVAAELRAIGAPAPVPLTPAEYNPFNEIDVTERADASSAAPVARAPDPGRRGVWLWAGAAVLLVAVVVAAVAAVAAQTGKKGQPEMDSPAPVVDGAAVKKDVPKIDPKKDEPKVYTDRAVAEWALEVGGLVTVRIGGREREIDAPDKLPAGPFMVTRLNLASTGTRVTDAGLGRLKGLTELWRLSLGGTAVTDAGLEHLSKLSSLKRIYLDSTRVVGPGLVHLTHIEVLGLEYCKIDNAGLKYLNGHERLRSLGLTDAPLTDGAAEHLKKITTLESLYLAGTGVGDTTLDQLRGLPRLARLNLTKTNVTAAGVARFQAAMPNCEVLRSSVAKPPDDR